MLFFVVAGAALPTCEQFDDIDINPHTQVRFEGSIARWWLKSFPSDALVLCEEEWDRAAPTSAMFGEREREASLEMVNTDPIITSTQTPG